MKKFLVNTIVVTVFIVSVMFLLNSSEDLSPGVIWGIVFFNLAALVLQAFVYNYRKVGL